MDDAPLLPDYGGACIANLVPALLGGGERPDWLPEPVRAARQVVLLVLDGLGWEQLRERSHLTPALGGLVGGPATSVAPTTTATALTSISTGLPPARHGVLGYRVRVTPDGRDAVLNVLRWRTPAGDARASVPPASICGVVPFAGTAPPVVTRAEFAETGFTLAHLAGVRLVGYRVPSTLVVEVRRLLEAGERFVYAYYDGVDKVAHEFGLGEHYEAEVVAADRLVGDLLAALPPGACLLVTADHGQVHVGEAVVPLHADVMADVALLSGEGRFRWLHARPGTAGRLAECARAHHGHDAWVRTRADMVAEGWFGGPLDPATAARLGDVALVAREPVAFVDPADTGEVRLVCRHGSLTPAEVLVPLVAGPA